jgi:alpha-N-arabinofuranosidase
MKRREFLAKSAALAAVLLAPRTARAPDSHIEILVDEPIGTIQPELHGHFIEHVGGTIL